jgi:hypothetical protein
MYIKDRVENLSLSWDILVCVVSDHLAAMAGSKTGLVRYLNKILIQLIILQLFTVSCIRKAYAQSVRLNNVSSIVNMTKLIGFQRFNHLQFKAFHEELESKYGNQSYHCDVYCMSHGKVMDHFFHPLEEISMFKEMKNKVSPSPKT